MRHIREILRLRFAEEVSGRVIAKRLGMNQGVVSSYIRRARAVGLSWPVPTDIDDEQLKALLFPHQPNGSTTIWTHELHAAVVQLVNKNISRSEIGRRHGLTKNQVIGRLHRTAEPSSTTMSRLQEMHDKLDAALAQDAADREAGKFYVTDRSGQNAIPKAPITNPAWKVVALL